MARHRLGREKSRAASAACVVTLQGRVRRQAVEVSLLTGSSKPGHAEVVVPAAGADSGADVVAAVGVDEDLDVVADDLADEALARSRNRPSGTSSSPAARSHNAASSADGAHVATPGWPMSAVNHAGHQFCSWV